MNITEQLIDGNVVGSNPAYPREVAESLEQVPGEKIPYGRCRESIEEETLSAETTPITNTSICLGVQSVEERAGDQIRGPDLI